jgi:transposase
VITAKRLLYLVNVKRGGEKMSRHIGIDLHRNNFESCILSTNGRYYHRRWQMIDLPKFVSKLCPSDRVAVEMTGNTRLFYEAVAPSVQEVAVVNPYQFKVISESVKKTDARDAKMLALFSSKGLLPEVRMKDKTSSQIASLTQTRDKLVKLRTVLKNKINNICSAHGILLKREALGSDKKLDEILSMAFDVLVLAELQVLVDQIRSLNKSISQLEGTIKKEGSKLKGYDNLLSITGLGALSSSILLSVIGDIKDFKSEGKLASYFGIVPRIEQSNQTLRSGSITKRGSKLGRTTLVQCVLIAKRYSPYLSRYYERIKARRGTGKAIIAVARKFLGIIYQTLQNGWMFEDFPNFVLTDA